MSLAAQLNGFASAQSSAPKTARFFRLTFPEQGKIRLKIGPGDHTLQEWELSKEQLKGLVQDALPELLR